MGAPNAGKSTLLNALVGSKVSIVSPKPQTTRTRITGIAMAERAQLIFLDVPGVFSPKRTMERAMVAAAWSGAADADVVVVLVDARRQPDVPGDDTAMIIDHLKHKNRKAILVLNKVDLVPRPTLLAKAAAMTQPGSPFTDVFMISALTGSGVDDLRKHLAKISPDGPWLYPPDQLADIQERFLAAEITREKLFIALHDELPHALTVETERWEEKKDGSVRVEQRVIVTRDSQKPIILGAGGARIKAIGMASRKELEVIFGRPVHLFLQVSVDKDWAETPRHLRAMGLEAPRR